MGAVVAYESMYGNTRQIAEAIAEGLKPIGELEVVSVNAGDESRADDADVLIVGGPTHMHGLATSMSRKAAADAANEEEHVELEPGASTDPGCASGSASVRATASARPPSIPGSTSRRSSPAWPPAGSRSACAAAATS